MNLLKFSKDCMKIVRLLLKSSRCVCHSDFFIFLSMSLGWKVLPCLLVLIFLVTVGSEFQSITTMLYVLPSTIKFKCRVLLHFNRLTVFYDLNTKEETINGFLSFVLSARIEFQDQRRLYF